MVMDMSPNGRCTSCGPAFSKEFLPLFLLLFIIGM